MLTILHAADLHLDSPFRDLPAAQSSLRRAEQRALPQKLASLARERRAGLLLLSGDVLDGALASRETSETLARALGQAGCPVFLAPGNHDPFLPRSPYAAMAWPDNIHIFSSPSPEAVPLPGLGCVVHGWAFTSPDREDDPLARFTAPADGLIHIAVLHGDVGGRRYGPIAPASLSASGLDYAALGHVHTCSGLQREGNTFWAYPGCPEGRGFDECGEKGALLLTLEKGRTEAEFVPLCARRYERVTVPLTPEGDPASAALRALEGRGEDICRLTFTGEREIPPDLPALERRLSGACFALSLRDGTTLPRDLWARAGEDSLAGLFLEEMRAKLEGASDEEERAVFELAIRFGLAALEGREDCRP